MRRQSMFDDDQVLIPSTTLMAVMKGDKAKVPNTRLFMSRDDSSMASTPEPEGGPLPQRNAEPTPPTNAPDGLPAALITVPMTGPDSVEAIIHRVLGGMTSARRRGLGASARRKGRHDTSGDDGGDEDEDDVLKREQKSAILMGTRNNHLVSEACLKTSAAKTDHSTGQSPKLFQACIEDQPG
jgi:hypothetical protein